MNVGDYLAYGTASLWFLGIVILFLGIVLLLQLKQSKIIFLEMKKGREATDNLRSELNTISKDLSADTCKLDKTTSGLDKQLQRLSEIIGGFEKTLESQFGYWRRQFRYWEQYVGGGESE